LLSLHDFNPFLEFLLVYSFIDILIDHFMSNYLFNLILLIFSKLADIFEKLFMFGSIDTGDKYILFLYLAVKLLIFGSVL
jgi:hypothetical protein